eukprot:2365241-Amphidinium_carterae.1
MAPTCVKLVPLGYNGMFAGIVSSLAPRALHWEVRQSKHFMERKRSDTLLKICLNSIYNYLPSGLAYLQFKFNAIPSHRDSLQDQFPKPPNR